MIGTIGRSFSDTRITSRATWGEAIDVGEMTRRNHRQRSIAFVISVRHRSPASIPAMSIHTESPAASSWPEIFSTNRRSCREYEMNSSDIDDRPNRQPRTKQHDPELAGVVGRDSHLDAARSSEVSTSVQSTTNASARRSPTSTPSRHSRTRQRSTARPALVRVSAVGGAKSSHPRPSPHARRMVCTSRRTPMSRRATSDVSVLEPQARTSFPRACGSD